MGKPQEIENLNQFSVIPREPVSTDKKGDQEVEPAVDLQRKHSFTPVKAMKVEYWNQGERPMAKKPEHGLNKRNHAQRASHHARRADQLGVLLLGCALLVVILVSATLYLNNKNYLFSTSKVKETSTAVVDFYQGNHAFSEKVAEEKAAKEVLNGHQVHGISTVNDDLEVPLSEQMNSMNEKMEKMRKLRETDEVPPTPDTGPKVGMTPLKPTQDANFRSPLEFNKDLPKNLQTNQ
jgi:hypothetical protein